MVRVWRRACAPCLSLHTLFGCRMASVIRTATTLLASILVMLWSRFFNTLNQRMQNQTALENARYDLGDCPDPHDDKRLVKVDFAANNALSKTWSKSVTLARKTFTITIGVPIEVSLEASGEVSAQFSAGAFLDLQTKVIHHCTSESYVLILCRFRVWCWWHIRPRIWNQAWWEYQDKGISVCTRMHEYTNVHVRMSTHTHAGSNTHISLHVLAHRCTPVHIGCCQSCSSQSRN